MLLLSLRRVGVYFVSLIPGVTAEEKNHDKETEETKCCSDQNRV
jgi:hypothetical protein